MEAQMTSNDPSPFLIYAPGLAPTREFSQLANRLESGDTLVYQDFLNQSLMRKRTVIQMALIETPIHQPVPGVRVKAVPGQLKNGMWRSFFPSRSAR